MLGSPDNGVPVLKTPQARWRRVVMPLVISVAVAVVVLILTNGRGGSSGISGSGSTLAQPLILEAANDYRNTVAADRSDRRDQAGGDWVIDGPGIDYEPVGSLGGLMRLSDPEVDFAVTDYPLSAQGLDDRSVEQFPVAIGAVAVVHNLDLPGDQSLKLDADVLSRMYLGTLTAWNDDAIQALNPEIELPGTSVTAVHRTDGSGSTLGFTRYLAQESPRWAAGPGVDTTVEWPTTTGVTGSGEMVSEVEDTDGAIGYVDVGQATRAGLEVVAMASGAESFVDPTAAGMAAAVSEMDWSGSDRYVDPLAIADAPDAYPLTVAIYAMVRSEAKYAEDRERALRFLAYLIGEYDANTEELGYLPLPAEAAEAVTAHWRTHFDITL